MRRNKPVVSTAKVRGMIKKNGIGYVDASGRNFGSIYSGINVWQLCDNVYFKVFGFNNAETIAKNLEKFTAVLDAEGFAVEKTYSAITTYQIVKKENA